MVNSLREQGGDEQKAAGGEEASNLTEFKTLQREEKKGVGKNAAATQAGSKVEFPGEEETSSVDGALRLSHAVPNLRRKSSRMRFDPDEAFVRRESHRLTTSTRNRLECVSEEGEATHPPLRTLSSSKSSSPYTFKSVSVSYAASLAHSTHRPFRRAFSEGAVQSSAAIHHQTSKKKKISLSSALLWPWIKLKNGYVNCMMGLEGSGDLSGMVQGGHFGCSSSKFFADMPLSKLDSRNHG